MADSYTQFLKVTLPATGAYNNTWGAVLNADTFSLLDVAIAGWTTENVGVETTYAMPALTNGGGSDSRYFGLVFIGTPPSAVTVSIAATVTGKMYLIDNQTGQDLTFTYVGGTETATVAPGLLQLIWCDGSNVNAVDANAADSPALGGVPAANWVQGTYTTEQETDSVTVQNRIEIPTAWPWFTQADAGTIDFDCANGNAQTVTLQGSRIIAPPLNAVDGQELDLLIFQDSVGGRLLQWDTIFVFENGEPPTLATIPGGSDYFYCRYQFATNKWYVGHFANLNSGGGTTQGISISSNCEDWSLENVLGSFNTVAIYNITIEEGVTVKASSAGVPALDLSGITSGSTINLTNNGYILGHGGDGGRGGSWVGGASFGFVQKNTAGLAGGVAIKGPGSGVQLNVINNGFIWGGGGGGGAAGFSYTTGAGNQFSGGGGGGGAGNGRGGLAFPFGDSSNTVVGLDGLQGTFAYRGNAWGAAGSGAIEGTVAAGSAGQGGDWGTAGTAGTAGTGHAVTVAASAGGAAGNAIALNGGAITITGTSGGSSPGVKGAVS